ncbi:MAG: sulfatase-like hydrolase/transferase [Chitinophagaceae bacterium]|nr:sulfatase-like hydrolase/transferase [Chitinophagaceae bacterium]
MLVRYKIPKTILWVINLFLLFLAIFTIFRLATFFAFRPEKLSWSDCLPSFWLGLGYDLRWIALVLLPIVLVSLSPRLSPFYSEKNKKWWTWYLAIATFILFFFFAADFGSFTYNRTRLDAGALNFAEDASISLSMLWQSYPLFWLVMGLVVAVLFFRWMYHRSHWTVINRTDGHKIPYRRSWFIIAAVFLLVLVYGLGLRPLTWNRAFRMGDNFKSYLALNPLQNFFSTLRFRKPQINESKAREYYPIMADLLQVRDRSTFSYRRQYLPHGNSIESKPNIVLVLCESFSMYKSSLSGNPLNTTPYFQEMANKGIFFSRCFTPHFSTARGLFATITGIPDVQLYKFSTRNPLALNQHTIINSFEDYRKMYFLGGSPEFNNFEGILKNIDGLEMFTDGKFTSPRINVWGISDKNLFLEANQVFRLQQSPFFAIIQTADNHRPFMIPEEDSDFEKLNPSRDSLRRFGFDSPDEFNSFRYSDYCIKKFMEAAEKETYFHNTIFVFVGDHGVSGNAREIYPAPWTDQRLTDEHVPLLFYAPYLLTPQKREEVVSQIDVLPTMAGLLSQPYVNTTLGRNVLDAAHKNHMAFIINGQGRIGLVTDHYYFTMNIDMTSGDQPDTTGRIFFPDPQLHAIQPGAVDPAGKQADSIKKQMSELTQAWYETAKWMLINNPKQPAH